MTERVQIGKKILNANEQFAQDNKSFFKQGGILCLNMISSPGSGKTSILVRTVKQLAGVLRIGVIEGDIATDLDAERIRATNAPAVQIETHGSCHLSAQQVSWALGKLPTKELDCVIIENVGNLVCPSAFELGESAKVVVLSVAEGDDKPVKYPGIFSKAKALLINKVDLLDSAGLSDFDMNKVKRDALKLNSEIKIFDVSARTGHGFDEWCRWLVEEQKLFAVPR